MSTADFWNKLITFKLDPLTLHGAKSTPDPGLHRSSAVLISHPLGLPGFNQPPWTVQTSMSRWPRPTSSQRCLFACLPHGFLLCHCLLSLQPSIEDGVSYSLWGNPQPVEHGTRWKAPSRESARRYLCASQESLAELSSLWPPKNPPESTPIPLFFFPCHVLPALSLLGSSPQ